MTDRDRDRDRKRAGPRTPHSSIPSLFIHSTHILLCSHSELGTFLGPGDAAEDRTGQALVSMEISLQWRQI